MSSTHTIPQILATPESYYHTIFFISLYILIREGMKKRSRERYKDMK